MLKVPLPQLIVSGLAPLVGTAVGGLITYYVVTENARVEFVRSEYVSYMKEANRAISIKDEGKLTDEDKRRLFTSHAILFLSASKKVRCLSNKFVQAMSKDDSSGLNEYEEMLFAMTGETLGDKIDRDDSMGSC